MTPDEQLLLIFGTLHLVALGLGGVLFLMFLQSDSAAEWLPPDDEEPGGGGGGNDRLPGRRPKNSPSGGIPLPDAQPARVRLRTSHDRLADPRRRAPARRRVSEPRRAPTRVPR